MTFEALMPAPVDLAPDAAARDLRRLIVMAVQTETDTVKTFVLRPEGSAPLTFEAGQSLTLALDIGGERLYRTFSIASSPTRPDHIALTIKAHPHGRATRWLHDELTVGSVIEARPPRGQFTITRRSRDRLALLSAGSGASPLMAMLRYLADIGTDADIAWFHAARSPQEILFGRELEALQGRLPHLSVTVTVSQTAPGWCGFRGRISRRLISVAVPDLGWREVFCCGPAGFMDEARLIHAAEGGSSNLFHIEHFGPAPRMVRPAEPDLLSTASGHHISFNGKRFDALGSETLLEAATRQNIVIPCGCASGLCGTCRVRLVEGQVDMQHNGGLSPDEETAGYILACSSQARSDIKITL